MTKTPMLFLGLALASQCAIAQQVTIDGVVTMPYADPAYLNIGQGRLTATPSGTLTLSCPGVTTTAPNGTYAHLGTYFVPLDAPASSSPGKIRVDGVTYEAGNDPVEIHANGVTVIPAPGFTTCRRPGGQLPPASGAVVFYGPNSQVTFLNPAVKPRLDTTSIPYTLVLQTTSGDVICDPVPVAGPFIFADGYE